jgi:hypothetical protein
MSAVVVTPDDQDWYTNNQSWTIILDRFFQEVGPEKQDEFEWYADTIGINFSLIDEAKRAPVAQALLRTVEALTGPEAAEHGWDDDTNRIHLGKLAALLRPIIEA